MIGLLIGLWIGFLNAGAGRKFWGATNSTQVSRIIFALGSAIPLFFIVHPFNALLAAAALYFWRLSGWGDFFAAIHGRKSGWRQSGDAKWAVWLSDKLWPIDPQEGMQTRLKSTMDMSIRMALIIPAMILVNPIGVVIFPLLGISYFVAGFFGELKAVERAEFANGFMIGLAMVV